MRHDQVMTALCLWEAWLDFEVAGYAKVKADEDPGPTYKVLSQLRDGHGSFVCRQAMIDLTPACDEAWEAAVALNGGDYDGSFDFDFCPTFLASVAESGVLDATFNIQYQPREDRSLQAA